MFCKKLLIFVLLFLPLTACSPEELYQNDYVKEAHITDRTRAGQILEKLPAASEKTTVSLYDFQDMTGQFKNNEKYSEFSSAVTKGGLSILTKALLDAGNKGWFTVTERGGLKDLLQERQIIKVMRNEYAPDGTKPPELPPLIYSGMMLQGGIIGYDSNVITGGAGALYLGIGANTRYARDVVTVYLRVVSVQTGEVVLSVTSSKTIFSTSVDSNVLKYITFDRLLQAEAGFSLNEPVQLATRQAIETAVYSIVMEGAIQGMWDFKDAAAGKRAIDEYVTRRDGQGGGLPAAADDKVFERAMSAAPSAGQATYAMEPVRVENPVREAAPAMAVTSQNLPPIPAQSEVAPAPKPVEPQVVPMQSQVVIVPAPQVPQVQAAPYEDRQPDIGPVSQNMEQGRVMPVSYQSARQRPRENIQPVYY